LDQVQFIAWKKFGDNDDNEDDFQLCVYRVDELVLMEELEEERSV
jgi:hypothetical protein